MEIDQHLKGSFPVRPEHVAALVSPVLPKTNATVVGVHVSGPWQGETSVQIGEQLHPVVYCTSTLAVREALDQHGLRDEPPLILLTPLSEDALGWDVLARLAKQRLLKTEPWSIVRDLFRAHSVDPRITAHPWIARLLLDRAPSEGYPPVPGGALDADTAWFHVLERTLGVKSRRPDADVLLAASLEEGFVARYEALPDEVRHELASRIEATAGPLGRLLVAALEAGQGHWLLPIGLACDVLFPQDAPGSPELERAVVRLESYVGGQVVEREQGTRWSAAAQRVMDRLHDTEHGSVYQQTVYQQTEELLRELRAEAFVGLSSVLPTGYERRLDTFRQRLLTFLDDGSDTADLEEALQRIEEHQSGSRNEEDSRIERLQMVLRLARYVQHCIESDSTVVRSLSDTVGAYVREGSYVDWARTLLVGGAQESGLANALNQLNDRVRVLRERENHTFAKQLAAWNEAPSAEPNVIPIERVLNALVVPAAEQSPVLFLVLDGMGFASFRQLQQQFRDRGWEEWSQNGGQQRTAALAVTPSITRFSRASLFAGRLNEGTSRHEKRAFEQHPGLVGVSTRKKLPLLFHKGELTEGATSGLAEPVREALGDADQQVVGLVLNVLDDSLAKSDQVLPRWTLDRIRLLEAILFEARVARRVVILASDHGHVLEADGKSLPGDSEERWRTFSEPIAEEEIVLSGPRIEAVVGTSKIVVPWSECVRYTRKKAGYHGGAAPQEMILPVAVFAASEDPLEDWTLQAEQPPIWWSAVEEIEDDSLVLLRESSTQIRKAKGQPSLFDNDVPPEPASDLIAALLGSATYASQRKLAGRSAPADEHLSAFLGLLEQHHHCISRTSLGRALGIPRNQLRVLLTGLQRILNVDGYPVLVVDSTSDTVTLDSALLRKQFLPEP